MWVAYLSLLVITIKIKQVVCIRKKTNEKDYQTPAALLMKTTKLVHCIAIFEYHNLTEDHFKYIFAIPVSNTSWSSLLICTSKIESFVKMYFELKMSLCETTMAGLENDI